MKIFLTSASLAALLLAVPACGQEVAKKPLPAPALDESAAEAPATETAVLAGGCFWGIQGVFQHVKGVSQALSGYAGGKGDVGYEDVSSGTTGNAETVKITFDPKVVSYGTILRIYFSVMDPTELNYQGPDEGTQYRSEIFATSKKQAGIARAYIAQLTAAHAFSAPIVTKVGDFTGFTPAEDYHQDYLVRHPDQPYIVINDLPKIAALKSLYPDYYHFRPKTVAAF